MFEYLPDVCRELNGSVREIYWILLAPFTILLIILEFFQITEEKSNIEGTLKRVMISMILLLVFDDCINTIAMVGDGLTEKIQDLGEFKSLLTYLEAHYQQKEMSWLKIREGIVFILCIISYIVAYAGVFIAHVLIQFSWSVLYVCSPLMILMYVSKRTSFVTASLFRGLINVIVWKVLWSLLGVMLLKFATHPHVEDPESTLTTIMVNFCVGMSMLFIPLTTRSLIRDGMVSSASALAMGSAFAVSQAVKGFLMTKGGGLTKGALSKAKYGMSQLKTPLKSGVQMGLQGGGAFGLRGGLQRGVNLHAQRKDSEKERGQGQGLGERPRKNQNLGMGLEQGKGKSGEGKNEKPGQRGPRPHIGALRKNHYGKKDGAGKTITSKPSEQ